jgi:hypothetical protein
MYNISLFFLVLPDTALAGRLFVWGFEFGFCIIIGYQVIVF